MRSRGKGLVFMQSLAVYSFAQVALGVALKKSLYLADAMNLRDGSGSLNPAAQRAQAKYYWLLQGSLALVVLLLGLQALENMGVRRELGSVRLRARGALLLGVARKGDERKRVWGVRLVFFPALLLPWALLDAAPVWLLLTDVTLLLALVAFHAITGRFKRRRKFNRAVAAVLAIAKLKAMVRRRRLAWASQRSLLAAEEARNAAMAAAAAAADAVAVARAARLAESRRERLARKLAEANIYQAPVLHREWQQLHVGGHGGSGGGTRTSNSASTNNNNSNSNSTSTSNSNSTSTSTSISTSTSTSISTTGTSTGTGTGTSTMTKSTGPCCFSTSPLSAPRHAPTSSASAQRRGGSTSGFTLRSCSRCSTAGSRILLLPRDVRVAGSRAQGTRRHAGPACRTHGCLGRRDRRPAPAARAADAQLRLGRRAAALPSLFSAALHRGVALVPRLAGRQVGGRATASPRPSWASCSCSARSAP